MSSNVPLYSMANEVRWDELLGPFSWLVVVFEREEAMGGERKHDLAL